MSAHSKRRKGLPGTSQEIIDYAKPGGASPVKDPRQDSFSFLFLPSLKPPLEGSEVTARVQGGENPQDPAS